MNNKITKDKDGYDKITKEEFFNLDSGTVQDITQKFIYPHILRNQSALIKQMQDLEVDGFLMWEDVENFHLSDEEILEEYEDKKERYSMTPIIDDDDYVSEEEFIENFREEGLDQKEIFEWYLVSDWLINKLREKNEPVIDNDYGEYWGRCCTGQAICLDYQIQELAYEYSDNGRLFKHIKDFECTK